MRCGNCVAEFWETYGSLSQDEAMNQGYDAAIRKFWRCNNAGDDVVIFTSELAGRFMYITRNAE